MVIRKYRLSGPGIFGQKSAILATSQHTDEGEQCEIAILERTLQLFPPILGQKTREMPTSWGSAQEGLSGLIRQTSSPPQPSLRPLTQLSIANDVWLG